MTSSERRSSTSWSGRSELDAGFVLREDIIKLQHKMNSTREKWRGSKYDFYLIAHEHLYVFRKPSTRIERSFSIILNLSTYSGRSSLIPAPTLHGPRR